MRRSWPTAIGFMAPWVVGVIVLTVIPLAGIVVISCVETTGADLARARPVGLDQYRTALGWPTGEHARSVQDPPRGIDRLSRGDPRFRKALAHSAFYTVFAVPLGLVWSLGCALLLRRSFRGASLVRATVYLPHLLGGAATIVIWSWLLNPRFGWVNEGIRLLYAALDPLIGWFGLGGTRNWPVPDWLYSPSACKPAVILMNTWTMGGAMLIYVAALRRVPATLYDAAAMDGASSIRRFLHVTWPHITPAVLFNLTVSTVFCMQSFGEAYLLSNRAQDDGLLFYALYMYELAFEPPYRMGYAAALACLLVAILAVVVGLLFVTSRRWVFYAGAAR